MTKLRHRIIPWLLPGILMVIFFILRSYHLSTDLLFHRDQGLHSLSIWRIWHDRQLSLLGHPSDVDGLFHAPIYYWLMLPAYALSGGSPYVASLFQIFLETLSLPFLFLALKKLFNHRTALLSLLLSTFSYGLICYSRWLVNVTPIFPLTNFLLFFLTLEKRDPRYVFVSSFLVGLITQCNAAIGVFLLPFLLWYYLRPFSFKTLLTVLVGFFLPALPLLAFELRHHFVLSQALLTFSSGGGGLGLPFSILLNNLNIFFKELSHLVSYPSLWSTIILFVLGLFSIRHLTHARFIYAYLFIPFLGLAFFQRGAIGFFFVALFPLALAVIAYFITTLPHLLRLLLISSLLFLNIFHLPLIYYPTNALIPIGNANLITLEDRQRVVDWLYIQADGQPFSVWFYTIPYFQEEVWQYIFLWYGQPKYGYLPKKTSSFNKGDLQDSAFFFAVWEPDEDQPHKLEAWQTKVGEEFGLATDQFQSHDLWVKEYPL